MRNNLMYINGEWVGKDLEKLEVVNPANGQVVGTVPIGGEAEANEAIDSAHEAFQTWSQTTAYERATYLKRLNDLILKNQEELAQVMTIEMGKPIKESRGKQPPPPHILNGLRKKGNEFTVKRYLPISRINECKFGKNLLG